MDKAAENFQELAANVLENRKVDDEWRERLLTELVEASKLEDQESFQELLRNTEKGVSERTAIANQEAITTLISSIEPPDVDQDIGPGVGVRLFPSFYWLLGIDPQTVLCNPVFGCFLWALRRGMQGELPKGMEDPLSPAPYRELLAAIAERIVQPTLMEELYLRLFSSNKQWGDRRHLLCKYKYLHGKATKLCRGKYGLARRKAVFEEFPELNENTFIQDLSRSQIEPKWVALNFLARMYGSNPNDVGKELTKARKSCRAAKSQPSEDQVRMSGGLLEVERVVNRHAAKAAQVANWQHLRQVPL